MEEEEGTQHDNISALLNSAASAGVSTNSSAKPILGPAAKPDAEPGPVAKPGPAAEPGPELGPAAINYPTGNAPHWRIQKKQKRAPASGK
ncbi:collagen alpha-1 chain-like protein [Lasius niger]|uniref:Collagen alpha-1 chain-like protein n=1 Tax=Lasius niger TaxID=67767 RepID=A0A0J7MQ65_LASNI|nr:collagen alpha-1 chain-like protein [Lasius niger]